MGRSHDPEGPPEGWPEAVPVTSPSTPGQDDLEWARRAQDGDLVAFNAIVERYQARAYNLALRMLRSPAAAEDATQEAFFSAYRHIGSFRGGSLRSWLLTIVANAARDALRAPSRRRTTSLEAYTEGGDPGGPWPHPDPQPDEQAVRAETSRQVHEALDRLPDDQRLVVTLVDLEGLDYEEAAQVARVPIGTVRSRLFRGRSRLRDLLRPVLELSGDAPRQSNGGK